MEDDLKREADQHTASPGKQKDAPVLSTKLAASVDRLSKPKFQKPSVNRAAFRNQTSPGSKKNETELKYYSSEKSLLSSASKEMLNSEEQLSSETGDQVMTNVTEWQQGQLLNVPRRSTNLSRDLASSVERLSRPKSRKKSINKNRFSLNLDEQRKFLEEVLESGLPEKDIAMSPSSSVESICSVNSRTSFGSKSSVSGNATSTKGLRKQNGGRNERYSNIDRSVTIGRKKARSERMLASVDNLNSSMHVRNFAAAKSSSCNKPGNLSISKKAVSMSNVGSRLASPTISSSMKFRVGSDVKLNAEKSPSVTSLVSSGKTKTKNAQRKYQSTLNVHSKDQDDSVSKRMKTLAGMLFLF